MDFSWDKEQLEFKAAIIKFAENELNQGVEERDEKGEFSFENWKNAPILVSWASHFLKSMVVRMMIF